MSSQPLFPKEIIERTAECHLSRHSTFSLAIYVSVILVLIAALTSLPFVYVGVSVKSQGLIKAATDVSTLKATSTGHIKEVYIKENATVEKGQMLFAVQSPLLEVEEKHLQNELKEARLFLKDVNGLLSPSGHRFPMTNFYRQSLSGYHQKLTDRQTRFLKVKQDYERNKRLYEEKVIAAADFENFQFEFDKCKNEIELLKQNQLSQWQQEFRSYEKEVTDLENQLTQVQKEIQNLNINAPIAGTIQNLIGVYSGSTVFAGQELAQISPDTSLQAEVYVLPNDIGLLREGMDVRMQVGAFNYNQWGILHGKVKEISNDIQIVNNQPLFEVKCSLDKDHLSLKNGYQGKLKKGMTLQARFLVTERSLWQLLYDKVDDWVNPNLK
jgi:multidrug resistance efflux pump